MKKECIEVVNHSRVVFEENKSKLTVVNNLKNSITKVKVDGCQITNGIRCDHYFNTLETEHYIELKGQDIEYAIKQISETINQISVNTAAQKKVSFIICTRSPINSATIQNYRSKFRKQFNSDLIVKSSPFEYNLK